MIALRGANEMTSSRARATGAVYLLYFLTVTFATFLIGRAPVAYSNAGNLVANAIYIAVTLLLYEMFKPVSRRFALLAVAISLVGCIVQSLSLFHLAAPHSSLPIFGLFNLAIGYLIVRSTFLPHTLGVLMMLSGLGWLTVASPELVVHISAYVEVLGIAAEGFLMLWLLLAGVNVRRWNEQAAAVSR
jgi:hypothetical protein